MTKLLEQAIAKARDLPEAEQDSLAAVMLSIFAADASSIPIDRDTENAIREGLAQADRGEFVSDDVVRQSNKRHGI